ncbi:hypothetical protein GF362_04665 [Candidatus Dojkabacteria bacterium]|nr:hypothetical protein [Candidatus Dojkabacteria bacterium]
MGLIERIAANAATKAVNSQKTQKDKNKMALIIVGVCMAILVGIIGLVVVLDAVA